MTNRCARILVFDSGVGGLTVYQELCKVLGKVEYVYCFDNAFFPYGMKEDGEIIDRVTKLLPRLVENYKASILVLACNTASTIALQDIRKALQIPVVGVVPAIKVAAALTKTRVIGLLATEATVRRKYTEQLIEDFAWDCEFVKLGSRKLVDFAEDKLRGKSVSDADLVFELHPFFQNPSLDTVILACTHFDHLKDDFVRLAPRPISWISSANAVAARTQSLAKEIRLPECASPRNILVSSQVIEKTFMTALKKAYAFQSCETFVVK